MWQMKQRTVYLGPEHSLSVIAETPTCIKFIYICTLINNIYDTAMYILQTGFSYRGCEIIYLLHKSKIMFLFIYRIVSVDMNTDISSEVEILCSQGDCSLMIEPIRMAVMKDKMYAIENSQKKISSAFQGISKFCLYNFSVCGPKWLY